MTTSWPSRGKRSSTHEAYWAKGGPELMLRTAFGFSGQRAPADGATLSYGAADDDVRLVDKGAVPGAGPVVAYFGIAIPSLAIRR